MCAIRRKARLFVQSTHLLAEGPLWFEGHWWWVDIEGGSIQGCDITGVGRGCHHFEDAVPAFAPWDADHFLVALRRRIIRWNRHTHESTELARLDDGIEPAVNRFNDGKRDPWGRFVIGTLTSKDTRGSAHLYSLDPVRNPGRLKVLLSGVDVSNGLAWAPDGRILYHVDSLKRTVVAHDYHPETGDLSPGRVVVQIPEDAGIPDGMDMDSAGNLWVAHWNGGAVRCWSPRTGQCLEEIMLPCSRPTSCYFGGPGGCSLLITTARTGLSEDQLAREPLAGSIFLLEAAQRL